VFYVGDEVRDVLAASEAGVRSVAVSWGYNDRSVLEAARPDFVLDVPNQIIELFASLAARA
jgi:phosphoglycolate phosphatase